MPGLSLSYCSMSTPTTKYSPDGLMRESFFLLSLFCGKCRCGKFSGVLSCLSLVGGEEADASRCSFQYQGRWESFVTCATLWKLRIHSHCV